MMTCAGSLNILRRAPQSKVKTKYYGKRRNKRAMVFSKMSDAWGSEISGRTRER